MCSAHRLHDSVITNTQARRTRPLSGSRNWPATSRRIVARGADGASRRRKRFTEDRARRRYRRQQRGQRGEVGHGAASEDAVTVGPDAIPGDGVTTDAEVAGDATIRLAQLQPPENLTVCRSPDSSVPPLVTSWSA
jgi:hypothetical protein